MTQNIDALLNELELAWGIIANASGGNWERESAEWRDAAERWRDRVMPLVGKWAAENTEARAKHSASSAPLSTEIIAR